MAARAVGGLTVLLLGLALASTLLLRADTGRTASLPDCGTNAIACENSLPGSPRSEWDIIGAGDDSIQGYATPFSVESRADRQLQGEDGRIRTIASTSIGSATTAGSEPGRSRPSHPARRCRSNSRHACRRRPPASSIAATGRFRRPSTSQRPRSRASMSASWSGPTQERRATSTSSSATTSATRTSCFRRRTRPGRPTTATAATAFTSALLRVGHTRSATTGRLRREDTRTSRSSSAADTR